MKNAVYAAYYSRVLAKRGCSGTNLERKMATFAVAIHSVGYASDGALAQAVGLATGSIHGIQMVFRNEGVDTTHNPDFTLLEAY